MACASRELLLAALAGTVLVGGCSRLNPVWCAREARCAPGEICDPTTNTCRRREGGVGRELGSDAPRGDGVGDGRRDGAGDRGRRDVARDLAPSCAAASSGWICSGGAAWRCGEGGPVQQRSCPQQQCASGHCVAPATPTACKSAKDCLSLGVWVCTWLLDDKLAAKQLCAPPAGGMPPPATCTSGLECQSGLCTTSNQCYAPCEDKAQCLAQFDCRDTTFSVEGVKVSARSCEQL